MGDSSPAFSKGPVMRAVISNEALGTGRGAHNWMPVRGQFLRANYQRMGWRAGWLRPHCGGENSGVFQGAGVTR